MTYTRADALETLRNKCRTLARTATKGEPGLVVVDGFDWEMMLVTLDWLDADDKVTVEKNEAA